MVDPDESAKIFAQLFATAFDPNVWRARLAVEAIAGYTPAPDTQLGFLRFHAFFSSNPLPKYLAAWRADPKLEHWTRQHIDGVHGHARNAFSGVLYHRDRLLEIEANMISALEKIPFQDAIAEGAVAGLGNTLKWDFEYQAFVLAARRCLDHLTLALMAYFKLKHHSFNKMPTYLKNKHKADVAAELLRIHAEQAPKLAYILSEGGKLSSVRDRIAHREHVGAGAINLKRNGVSFVGGGEDLKPWENGEQRLGVVIQRRVDELLECVNAFIDGFIAAVSTHERNAGTESTEQGKAGPRVRPA